jgi:thioredoxin-related protein
MLRLSPTRSSGANMDQLKKRINLVVNLLIVAVLVCIGVVLVKHYRFSSRPATPPRDYHVAAGSKISLRDIDWEKNGQTLLLVMDTECSYCAASAPFYQQIVRENAQKRKVQLIAVLPQDVANSKQYLNHLGVPIDEVRQSALDPLGVKGTPTLILINDKAEVVRSWPGKLTPEEEKDVLRQIL